MIYHHGTALILREVAAKHGISVAQLVGRKDRRLLAPARREAMNRLYSERGVTVPHIARIFRRHHTTCLYLMGRTSKARPAEWRLAA